MKIHQLPMGSHFLYQGDEYVKSGPMVATGPSGQRLIPKHAVLEPLPGTQPFPEQAPGRIPTREELLRAFDAFYETCRSLVPPEQTNRLDAARTLFLRSIGQS